MLTAIHSARIYPVNPDFDVYLNGTIIFDEKKIHAVGPSATTSIPPDARVLDGSRWAIMPGMIDVHCHSSLLKGFSENAQLMDWLPEYQREHQVLNEQDAYYACLVTYLEALKGGTTLVADMYRKLLQGARAAAELGMRVDLIPYAADNPSKTFFETLDDTTSMIQAVQDMSDEKITPWVGLEHITYCSAEMYQAALQISDQYGVNIHTHTSEQAEEVETVVELFGQRPVPQFEEYGILREGTVLAHCVWLDASEIEVLARTGTGVAHCPTSNMKLASGSAPLQTYLDNAIPVGLGSDGGISNNSMSMFESMKLASLLQKVTLLDATAIDARLAMELATIRGAQLLGHADRIGSLEPGKDADLIAVDLWQPHLMPLIDSEGHDPVLWNLVFAARASDVTHVWVQGKQLLDGGVLTQVDEEAMKAAIHQQTVDLLSRRVNAPPVPMV